MLQQASCISVTTVSGSAALRLHRYAARGGIFFRPDGALVYYYTLCKSSLMTGCRWSRLMCMASLNARLLASWLEGVVVTVVVFGSVWYIHLTGSVTRNGDQLRLKVGSKA
jgi:hypothetical protein